MTSQPPSPVTPSRRPRSLRNSSYDLFTDGYSSPYTNGTSTINNVTLSRQSSRTSQNFYQPISPTTPRPGSSKSSRPMSFQHRRKSSSRFSIGSSMSLGQEDGGLGNLADELEDALDDEYDEQGANYLEDLREGSAEPLNVSSQSSYDTNDMHESDIEGEGQLQTEELKHVPVTEPGSQLSRAEKRKSRHQKTESRYSMSDQRVDSDQEDGEFSPMLLKTIQDLESITRKSTNTEDTLSEGGGVIIRTTHALKDLGNQTNIENNLSRITTAYTSMAAHRSYKTRDLFSQAHSLLYNHILEVPEDMIDLLLSDVDLLLSATSVCQKQNPLVSLQILASQTIDLAQTLRSLTDVIQESRISYNTASRKLKNVKDMVEEMRIEQELTETSMMLIQAGDWDRRCRERQAAATCREVINGFGEMWGLEVDERSWIRERKQVTTS